MFHSVDPSGSVLSMTEAQLDSLLTSIKASGHDVVPLPELLAHPDRERAVALTFDDGMATLATAAAPIIARHGATATLFATTGYIGQANNWPSQAPSAPYMAMLDWDGVRGLAAQGWNIEAHTRSHPDLRLSSDAELERELREPIEVIADAVGHRPTLFAYPYGYLDARVVAATTRYYAYAVSTTFAPLPRAIENRHRVPRLDTYYLRSPRVHRGFGGHLFRTYLAARATARRARNHPGETGLV